MVSLEDEKVRLLAGVGGGITGFLLLTVSSYLGFLTLFTDLGLENEFNPSNLIQYTLGAEYDLLSPIWQYMILSGSMLMIGAPIAFLIVIPYRIRRDQKRSLSPTTQRIRTTQTQIFCRECGGSNSKSQKFCGNCGASLQ